MLHCRRWTLLLGLVMSATPSVAQRPGTFANPLDLDYRFMPARPSRREAADPMIVLYKDTYYLFASKSGGYWTSDDLVHWSLVIPTGYPLEDYAPAVVNIGGKLYYTAHKAMAVFTTDDPKRGEWRKVADIGSYADPAFFLDDDGKLYLYFGSGLNGGISAVELDPQTFAVRAGPTQLFKANHLEHGWERSGADNLGAVMTEGFRIGPYVEGSWMTKHDGIYYLQYAAPGTVWKSYADGAYTSRSPMSGFMYAPYSPFSYKPGGFVGSAGHSGMFKDKKGNWWRVTTLDVSVIHKFERRLGIFPAGFDADGVIRTNTYLGDYPQYAPGVRANPLETNRASFMLLSARATATASSSTDNHEPGLAFDEDIRTHWSARSANRGEWLMADLHDVVTPRALQINLAEDGATALGRATTGVARYLVESSVDGNRWEVIHDRRDSTRDAPHAYMELTAPRAARFVRITNVEMPGGGTFAISDLRVFGTSTEPPPPQVKGATVTRNTEDDRSVTIRWTRVPGAYDYVVRYGISRDKLYNNIQVGDVDSVTMNSLNHGVAYYFTVDAVGRGGVTAGGAPRQ